MAMDLEGFASEYERHVNQRQAQGIPPLPLSPGQTAAVCAALAQPQLPASLLRLHGQPDTVSTLRHLLAERVPPGVYPASKVKAELLGQLARGELRSPHLGMVDALAMLGQMGGGYNVAPLLAVLEAGGDHAAQAARLLEDLILVTVDDVDRVKSLARGNSEPARVLLARWAEASWFAHQPEIPPQQQRVVIRTTGEINTDFFSPAQEASTRDDIPLHALCILSTSPHDRDFLERRARLLEESGLPLLFVGDVVGTGSSRKSASNSLVWWIGDDIPGVPNKRRGGLVLAAKIAPIFFNTIRGCGAIPVRCSTGDLQEGTRVTVDLERGEVRADHSGKVLTRIEVQPATILDEARAGGRNNLIIGRKLVATARAACSELGLAVSEPAVTPAQPAAHAQGTRYSLAQKLVGAAAGLPGVLPGDYVEPRAHLVFSQDTTGKMTQQEILELATLRFAAPTIQSFCHTAAGPKSKDARMQTDLGAFIAEMGGIDLRPGDGVIHTNGNRFLLPYFVGTGGDSHTRFPIGLSFPAGSDLVAFAASQGYFPLDMPQSLLARFRGRPRPGITVRDLVNAIPYAALQQNKLNLGKGDAKVNCFADRLLEIEGLEHLTVEEAYKLTDASAERSAAGSTFHHAPGQVVAYVENNLRFLERNFGPRHPARVVQTIVEQMKAWLKSPVVPEADEGPTYADVVEIDLERITEPLLAAPNDPDKIVTLSEVAGTRIDEVFVGSCMVDITDFRAVARLLQGQRVQHRVKLWTVPPDRESNAQLAREGVHAALLEAGANVHVPGCSLCMGNQAQVATGATVLSTSTRNFDNRMGLGSQVFLGSAHLAAVTAILGELPTVPTYLEYFGKLEAELDRIRQPLHHA